MKEFIKVFSFILVVGTIFLKITLLSMRLVTNLVVDINKFFYQKVGGKYFNNT